MYSKMCTYHIKKKEKKFKETLLAIEKQSKEKRNLHYQSFSLIWNFSLVTFSNHDISTYVLTDPNIYPKKKHWVHPSISWQPNRVLFHHFNAKKIIIITIIIFNYKP